MLLSVGERFSSAYIPKQTCTRYIVAAVAADALGHPQLESRASCSGSAICNTCRGGSTIRARNYLLHGLHRLIGCEVMHHVAQTRK